MPLRLPSGSRIAPIPSDVVAGLASASTLLRQAREIEEPGLPTLVKELGLTEDSSVQDSDKIPANARKEKGLKGAAVKEKDVKDKVVKTKVVKQNSAREKVVTTKKPVFKKPGSLQDDRMRLAHTEPFGAEPECRPKVPKDDGGAVKKTRKKRNKDEGEIQTKIKQAKVTKPRASGSIDKTKKPATTTKKPKDNNAGNSKAPTSTQDSDVQAREEFRDLCLEKAIPVRRDWTPVRDTVQEVTLMADVEDPKDSALLPRTTPINELHRVSFGKLFGDFGHAQTGERTDTIFEAIRPTNGEAIVKRRKIELVAGMAAPPPAKKAQRSKSPKKLQTVTAKATAPFMSIESLETPSLLQYFEPTVAEPEGLTNGQTSSIGAPATTMGKPLAKRATKVKLTTAKAKKAILLSPESAMKTAKNQELIFGTSSQLVRGESPSFLKDTQQAMKESESNEGDWEPSQPSAKFKPYNTLAFTESRNLWSEASRDFGGSLLDAEVVDLSETPKPLKTLTERPQPAAPPKPVEPQSKQGEGERLGAELTSNTPKLDIESTSALQQQLQQLEQTMPRSVAEAALKKRPKSRSPVKKFVASRLAPDQMPNYKGFTDVQLSKAVSAYGFKTVKKREGMIVLLQQCWESKVAMALQELPTNTSHPQAQHIEASNGSPKKSSPIKKRGRPPKVFDSTIVADSDMIKEPPVKKPRGRPRKDSTATTPPPKRKRKAASTSKAQAETATLAADDIYDSSPPTPSPPRRRSPPKSPAQLPLSQSAGTAPPPAKAGTTNGQASLFDSVTKAVTTFPPSHDPKNLTFYEKMLMYEPVILEDLAVWLNAEGLGKVGEDNEVSPLQVKEWCEERSVCCLWKENLRGGARARW